MKTEDQEDGKDMGERETGAAPAGLAAVATVRQPLPPVALECQRLRAELAVAARRVEDLTRENARQATEIEATCWQISPGMAQAKILQLNAEVESLRKGSATACKELREDRNQLLREHSGLRAEVERLRTELGALHGKIGLLAHELTTISDNAPTDECIEAIRHSFRAMLATLDVMKSLRDAERQALEEIKHAGSAEWARKRAERALETTL